ncbi:MAG: hypothetical protein ACK2U6_17470 [Candidatus Promineifilaceae bacterium]
MASFWQEMERNQAPAAQYYKQYSFSPLQKVPENSPLMAEKYNVQELHSENDLEFKEKRSWQK